MDNICSTKTITEITGNNAKIKCFSDMNDDGTTVPNLYQAEILSQEKQINGINGKEGELILASEDDTGNIGSLNDNGEAIIQLNEDDANKYSKDNDENLIYTK